MKLTRSLLLGLSAAANGNRDRRSILKAGFQATVAKNTTIWLDDPGEPCGKVPTPEWGVVTGDCKNKFHDDECQIDCLGGNSKYTCSCTEQVQGSKLVIARDSCEWILDRETYEDNCEGVTTTTSTTTTTTSTTTTTKPDVCEPLNDPFGKWKCTESAAEGSNCKVKCKPGYKPVNGRRRKCKCKVYKGGNPNDRDWKRIKCQWSAKRQRFFKERYPHCAKVDKTEEFDEVVDVTTHQFEQIVNEAELGVVLDDSIEVKRVGDIIIAAHADSL